MSENATKWVLKCVVDGTYLHRNGHRWMKKQRKAKRFDTAKEARDYMECWGASFASTVTVFRLTPKRRAQAPEPLRTPTQIASLAAAMTARWEAATASEQASALTMERIDGYGREYRRQWLAGVPNPVGFDELVAEIGSKPRRDWTSSDVACPRCKAVPGTRCVTEAGETNVLFHSERAIGAVRASLLLTPPDVAPPFTSFTVACPRCSAPPFMYCVDGADPYALKPGTPRLIAHDERFEAAGLHAPATPVAEETHPVVTMDRPVNTIPRAFADSLAKMFGFAADTTRPEERQRLLAMVDRVRSGSKHQIDELGRRIDVLIAAALGGKSVASNWTLVVKEIHDHRTATEGVVDGLRKELEDAYEKLAHERRTNQTLRGQNER